MFHWNSEQIEFGRSGYFNDIKMAIDPELNHSFKETFTARDKWSAIHFTKGRFRYVQFSNCPMPCPMDEVLFIVADCSSWPERS